MATSNWKIPQFENENRKLSFARKRQSRAITSTETLHAIGTHFQRGFADDAAATLPWHVLCIHRFAHDRDRSDSTAHLSFVSYPAITEDHSRYTEIDATSRNRRLRWSRYARATNLLSQRASYPTYSINSVCDLRSETRLGSRMASQPILS